MYLVGGHPTQNGRAAFARKIDQRAPTTRYRCRSFTGDLAPLCGNQSPGCHPTGFRRPSGRNRSGSGRRPHGHRARETDRSRISTLVGSRRGASDRHGTKWHRADLEFRLGFRLISRHCTPTVSTGRRKVENQKLPLASLPEGVEGLSPGAVHPTSTLGTEASSPASEARSISQICAVSGGHREVQAHPVVVLVQIFRKSLRGLSFLPFLPTCLRQF